jgi:hypothetical protein
MAVAELHVKHRQLVLELDKLLTKAIEEILNQETRKLNKI